MRLNLLTTFTTIILLAVFADVRPASAQSAMPDSSLAVRNVQVYRVCERTAELLIRAVFRYRAHLGMWPIEEEELKTFIATNSATPPPASWSPCTLSGSVDGCVVGVRITEGQRGRYLLPDSAELHRANATFYLTAEVDSKFVRAFVTGEVISAEILLPDGKMVQLPQFSPGTVRTLKTSASAPDSVLFSY
jgi:hypothetical protein